MKSLTRFYSITLIAFCICISNTSLAQANNNETNTLIQLVKNYQLDVAEGELESATNKAQKAYQLAKHLLGAEDKSFQTIADDYAYLSIKVEKPQQAIGVLQHLLTTKEQQYGKHAQELIPVLESLKQACSGDSELHKKYRLRHQRLVLRHHSAHYVKNYDKTPLESTQQAKNLAQKLRRVTGKNYQVTDGGKWDFIYNLDSHVDVAPILEQMDLGYRSSLGFLLAFNVLSKKIDDKFKAVYFDSRDDYIKFLDNYRSLNLSRGAARSAGMYIHFPVKSLFLFNRDSKNQKRNQFMVANTLRHEIAHQIFYELGFHIKGADYPRWLIEGFAESFEFTEMANISGPQTDNISVLLLKKVSKLRKEERLIPLRELVALNQVAEQNSTNTKDVYLTGSMLIRFLYLNHPDKLRDYIIDFSRRKSETSGERLSLFSRHFGAPEELQSQFEQFLDRHIQIAKSKSKKVRQKKSKS